MSYGEAGNFVDAREPASCYVIGTAIKAVTVSWPWQAGVELCGAHFGKFVLAHVNCARVSAAAAAAAGAPDGMFVVVVDG